MKITFKMVVIDKAKPEGDRLWFGHRIGRESMVPRLVENERKAIQAFASGRRVWSQWERVPKGTQTTLLMCFAGMFKDGKYSGRASTYHYWQIETL